MITLIYHRHDRRRNLKEQSCCCDTKPTRLQNNLICYSIEIATMFLLCLLTTSTTLIISITCVSGNVIEDTTTIVVAATDQGKEVVIDPMGDIVMTTSNINNKNNNNNSSNNSNFTSADLECRIWLAPSTLQGAGLGMYAGVNYYPDDEFLIGGDITIAITDIAEHNAAPGQDPYGHFLWDEYTWSASALKMDDIGNAQNIASEGFGSAANSFIPLYNVDEWCSQLVNTHSLHRSVDPGVGAYTQYHHRLSTARRYIEAGEELYVSYGDEWFRGRPGLGPIPLTDDLNIASSVVERYSSLQERLVKNVPNGYGLVVAKDVWITFVRNTPFNDSRVLIGAFHHDDPNELQNIITTFNNNVTAARVEDSKRDLDWLRSQGTCGDHIVAKPSTIPQAGMGGFATRFLPNNTIVAQLPMIHITNRSRFNTYGLSKKKDGTYAPYNDKIIGKQLLLNYCYGHAESTLLLCPYGPMNSYINHNQSLANVRLRWGRSESGNHNPNLLKSTIVNLSKDATAKLAMELIAVRDIEEGEEIFLDYGDEWEAAWQQHVQNWKPVPDADKYISAAQLDADQITRLRTVFEEIDHQTYPDNLQMKCDTSISSYPESTLSSFYDGTLKKFLWRNDLEWWPCTILRYHIDEKTGDYLYAVHLYSLSPDEDRTATSQLIENVPRQAIHFRDKPFTSDQHLPNAFRHDIRIDDKIFPIAWRNVLA